MRTFTLCLFALAIFVCLCQVCLCQVPSSQGLLDKFNDKEGYKKEVASFFNGNERSKRSAEESTISTSTTTSVTEEEKSAFASIGKAFDFVKDSVKNAYQNVTNSDAAAKISENFGKFKDGIKETGKKVKAAVHDYTAPSDDKSEEKQEKQ